MSSKGPVTKEQISKIIARGIEEGAQKASAKGIPIEKARARALERLGKWASKLAEPDRLSTKSEKSEKEILLEEIKSVACGMVKSKWPESNSDFEFTAKHIGKQAPLEMMDPKTLRKAFGKLPKLLGQGRDFRRLYIQAPSENPVIQPFDYSAFAFSAHPTEGYTDGVSRPYWATVAIFLPEKTAKKLFDFIMSEDRNFAIEVYETLFPDFAKHPETPNSLVLNSDLKFIKEGKKYQVPK